MADSSRSHIPNLSADELGRLPPDGGERYNRLIFEKSPYLLQHAENPVDWYPWGEAAFARARAEDKPVFLSIGYSTCHWCHVMAHESFADGEAAAVLQRHFIAIKVDREERPDVDAAYMAACQLLTGSGGWPLTVVLTPGREPFFAATYLPRQSRGGMTGLIPLLERIAELWRQDRSRVVATGSQLSSALLRREALAEDPAPLSDRPLRQALEQYRTDFDPRHGGFGHAPKFPAPHNLSLLLRLGSRFANPQATAMALETLRAMRLGGIYDQIGFGLHRYSVDERWLVPHFEKMLYDQALLILAAVEAWQVSGDPFFSQLARETGSYLLRDLRHPEGGFFCGDDADSEGDEGIFYLWSPEEVQAVLGSEPGTVYCRSFDVTAAGNFEGRNIPHLAEEVAALAQRAGVDPAALAAGLEESRRRLFAAREQRPRPHCDDKILAGWNGLAIAALARAGAGLNDPELLAAAGAAADFVTSRLRQPDGRLLRRWREGEAAVPAFLEDYAFLAWGLLELHQARFDDRDLELALDLTAAMERLFTDGSGGFFETGADAESVLGRGRSLQDGALPSGTSVAIGNLLRLGRLTGDPALEERGRQALARCLPQIDRYPPAFAQVLCALDFALGPVTEATLVPGSGGEPLDLLLLALRREFQPRLLLARAGGAGAAPIPALQDGPARSGQAAVYLCRDHACQPPVSDPVELTRRLRENRGLNDYPDR
jgi:uncharacterized protein YyaL (SSP411 family)